MSRAWRSVVALSGGVGGARLACGLARALPPGALTVIVNTGDDLEHWGLHVSPDVDTVMYTLAGLSPIDEGQRGWGLADESFHAFEMMRRCGGPDWFQLGDRDLATNLLRTQALAAGETLSQVTARLCRALGVATRVLPMSDGRCRTMIDTAEEGTLSFHGWLVRRRAAPVVRRVWFDGAPAPTPEVMAALREAELVVIGPSNPYVSIDPILALPGVREALAGRRVVGLSPLVGGKAVKGPLGQMIPDLAAQPPSSAAIARHYGALLAGLVVERGDEGELGALPVLATATVMRDAEDRLRLARELLDFAGALP